MRISVITPVLNVDKKLINLKSSLNRNSPNLFNWIIIGNKKNKKKIKKFILKNKNFYFLEQDDKGIYSAINVGISSKIVNQYYLVLGQDDLIINKNLFQELTVQINADIINDLSADIYELNTFSENKKKLNKLSKLRQNFSAIFNHHSGGMLIKTSLHKKFGYYDESYKLASDYKFLSKIKKKIFIKKVDILSAKIGINGSSAKRPLLGLFERLLIDIHEKHIFIKAIITIKYFFKMFKQIIFNRKFQ
tara:strand:+ start:174 stop:917 length:744 start_codon:yes stop_codon:yes gene_type:complete